MAIHSTIAQLVTRRRGLVWAVVALISAASITVLVLRMKLDTEVLNLLPGGFESVEGLKVYNRDFAQVRDLTFALVCQPDDADKLEEFAPQFAERDNPVASQAALRVAIHLARDRQRTRRFLADADETVSSAKFRAVIADVLPEFDAIPKPGRSAS